MNVTNNMTINISDISFLPGGMYIDEIDILLEYCNFLELDIYNGILILFTLFLVIEFMGILSYYFKSDSLGKYYKSMKLVYYYGHFVVLSATALRLIVYNRYIPVSILNNILLMLIVVTVGLLILKGRKIVNMINKYFRR